MTANDTSSTTAAPSSARVWAEIHPLRAAVENPYTSATSPRTTVTAPGMS